MMRYIMNKKRVLRLMRSMGIAGLFPGPNLCKRNHQHNTFRYLLRGLKAQRQDHTWGMKGKGIQLSMDGKGRATDNAITEPF